MHADLSVLSNWLIIKMEWIKENRKYEWRYIYIMVAIGYCNKIRNLLLDQLCQLSINELQNKRWNN